MTLSEENRHSFRICLAKYERYFHIKSFSSERFSAVYTSTSLTAGFVIPKMGSIKNGLFFPQMELTKLNLYVLRKRTIAAWSLSTPRTFIFNFEAPFETLQSVVKTTRITHVEKSNESKFPCNCRHFSWKAEGVAPIGVSTYIHSIGSDSY